jgi:hypothetical protein
MNRQTAPNRPCNVPGTASVEQGVILLDGPDGVAVAMTPEAAEGTADSLRAAAAQARADAAAARTRGGGDKE